jgi:hypothetical protein
VQDIDGPLAINDLCYECFSCRHDAAEAVPSNRNRELFSLLDCRKHLTSAARLITERRACIPGRRVSSVQHGNAAMPKPTHDPPVAFFEPPKGLAAPSRPAS